MRYTAIILVNWNNFDDTIECIESLLKLEFVSFKIIVADNNSENLSIKKIKEYFVRKIKVRVFNSCEMSNIENDNYDLAIINTGKNGGFGYANNVAVEFIKNDKNFEYIWLLNNDTVVDKKSLFYLLKDYKKYIDGKNIGAIGSAIYSYYDTHKLVLPGGLSTSNTLSFSSELRLDTEKKFFVFDGFISGASLFISKSLYLDIGGFDEAYFMYVEDVDFSRKLKLHGYKLGVSMRSIVYHKEGASTDKTVEKERPTIKQWKMWGYYELRNRTYYIKKYENIFYYILPIYWAIRRLVGAILYDEEKIKRCKLLFKALYDGFTGKMNA